MSAGNVLPNCKLITDEDYRRLSAAAVRRISAAEGCARLALETGCDERTMRNARDERGSLKAATLFNMLAKDATALDELLAHFGLKAVPSDAAKEDEGRLLAATAALVGAHAEAMADGVIDHQEEQRLAKLARPVAQMWGGRVAIADRKRA